MGGLNLEVFKFGMYVMFPIGIMYYFGTNLDNRFAVPDFWPKPENANKVPLEKEEIRAELERLRAKRLYLRDRRLAEEAAQSQAARPEEPVPQTPPPPQVPAAEQPKKGWTFWY